MQAHDCAREADVLDAVCARRWPHRVDDDLRAHVAGCRVCADVALVAEGLGADHEAAWIEAANLPRADVVWFRAQARARAAAEREAARPIAIMQALGLACATAVISAGIGVVAFWVWTRAALFERLSDLDILPLDSMGFAVRGILLAVSLWLVLAPVAVYLAAVDD